MYRNSGEQLFARVERIRSRAERLIQGSAAPPPPFDDDAEREAQAIAARVELRLPSLLARFALPPLAADVITCLVATEYDPFMRTLLRAVQRELGRPWIELGTIAELLDLPPSRIPELWSLLAPEGPLRRYALAACDDSVEAPVAATRVKLNSRVAQHLVGDDTLPDGIRRERSERRRREREQMLRALQATNGNKAEAARALGLARSTLVSRLKKHGLG